jgi:ubiquinone/menaquinone biosynthesis C-methylase UbiE
LKIQLLKYIRCPKCKKNLKTSQEFGPQEEITATTLFCDKGHVWEVNDSIPSLVHPRISAEDEKWIKEYDELAENYDELVKKYDEWLDVDLMKEREEFTHFIELEGPAKIIDVSVGTGANFEALYNHFKGKQMERFDLHGLDVSTGMLNVAKRKMDSLVIDVSLCHGSVFNIPYRDDMFDIVLHSGGINTFSDIPLGIREMQRIAKPGGFVIIIDEGMSPQVKNTPRGEAIIKTNSLFAARPPIEYIPDNVKDLEVSYVLNGTFYQMVFRK